MLPHSQGESACPNTDSPQTHLLPTERDLHIWVDKDFSLPYDLGDTTHDSCSHAGQALSTIQFDADPGPGSLCRDSLRQQQVPVRQIYVLPLSWSPQNTMMGNSLTAGRLDPALPPVFFTGSLPIRRGGNEAKKVV